MRIFTSAHNKTLLVLLVVLPILSALTVTSHAATGNTPTYVLGVSSPTDPLIVDLQSLTSSVTILPGISSLGLVGGNSILFVDGQWLQTSSSLDPTVLSLVASKAINAVPTIVIRGSPSLLADSISGLLKTRALGLPLISDGVQIFGTLPDGTRQAMVLQVLAGFDYAVQAEFTWAQQLLSQPTTTPLSASAPAPTSPTSGTTRGASRTVSPTATSATSTGSSFTLLGKFVTSTGDQFKDVGRFSYNFTIFRLQNSGSSSFKWYNFFFNETLQPGISIYNSGWRTAQELDQISATNQTSNLFVNHGPQTFGTIGPSSVTYTIGVTNGTLGARTTANQTQTYSLKNTQVADLSQGGSKVGWQHDINSRTDAGKLTFSIIPGWTDRVTSDGQISINGSFTSTFNNIMGGTVQTSSIQTTIAVFGG